VDATTTLAFVATLRALNTQIAALADRIAEQLALHPDGKLFTTRPRAGIVRAARLLAEIGDARGRFPTPESLACLAGVAPSTRQSGTMKMITFRRAADKQLRDARCDFAGDSRFANPWAAGIYDRTIARGLHHPKAVRVLARAWVGVIWRCWQNDTPDDPGRHRACNVLDGSPRPRIKDRQPVFGQDHRSAA
jgi:transposase